MISRILDLSESYPQADETLRNTIEVYKKCTDFFDELEFYIETLKGELDKCREAFKKQFRETFDEANTIGTFEDLSLPIKEIKELEEELDIFFHDVKIPKYVCEDLKIYEARLIEISMKQKE